MTANVLPDIDFSKLEELRKRLPDLSDIEVSAPRIDDVGKRAEKAVDRLLGRRRTPTWPWIAAAVGLIAVIGLLAAWLTWNRRPGWDAEPMVEPEGLEAAGATGSSMADVGWDSPGSGAGLTAAEASLTTNREPEERV